KVLHKSPPLRTFGLRFELWLGARSWQLEALHKILARQLANFAGQLQFEKGGKNRRGRKFRLQAFHQFVNVGGLVASEEAEDAPFVRREGVLFKQGCSSRG